MHRIRYDYEEESQVYLTGHDCINNSTTRDMTVSPIFIVHLLPSDYILSI